MMWTSQSVCWCTEAWRHCQGCSRLVEIPLWLTSLCPVQPCRPTSCPEEESGPWSSSSASSPPSSPPSWTTSPPWCSSRPLPSGAEQLCVQTISGFLQLLFIKIQRVQSRSGVFFFVFFWRGSDSCFWSVNFLEMRKSPSAALFPPLFGETFLWRHKGHLYLCQIRDHTPRQVLDPPPLRPPRFWNLPKHVEGPNRALHWLFSGETHLNV